MEGLKIIAPVFNLLYKALIAQCEKELGRELNKGKGAAKFGFGVSNGDPRSLKGVICKSEIVINHLKEKLPKEWKKQNSREGMSIEEKQRISEDFALDYFNGKYLYNKKNSIDKGSNTIELTGIYEEIFFIYLRVGSIHGFLEEIDKEILVTERDLQKDLAKLRDEDEFISPFASKYLSFYYSYRTHSIKTFIVEIDKINNRVRQKGFHLKQNKFESDNSYFQIEKSKIYLGTSNIMDECVSINLETSKLNNQKSYMNMYLFKGPMNLPEMSLVRGAMTTFSAYSYIFFGEIFLMRVNNTESDKRLLSKNYLKSIEDKSKRKEIGEKIKTIKRYLFTQRRTGRIPTTTQQDYNEIRAKREKLNVLDTMVGTWKIWGLNRKIEVVQSKMVINEDHSTYLYVSTYKGVEKQICNLRVSQGVDGKYVWISSFQEVEQKGEATIKVPSYQSKNKSITIGEVCNLGTYKNPITTSPIVLLKVNPENDFIPGKLTGRKLKEEIIHNSERHLHVKAYGKLEKFVEKMLSDKESNFTPLSRLTKEDENINQDTIRD